VVGVFVHCHSRAPIGAWTVGRSLSRITLGPERSGAILRRRLKRHFDVLFSIHIESQPNQLASFYVHRSFVRNTVYKRNHEFKPPLAVVLAPFQIDPLDDFRDLGFQLAANIRIVGIWIVQQFEQSFW
jgi:hypothetical protein